MLLKTSRKSDQVSEGILKNIGKRKVRKKVKDLISGLVNLELGIVSERDIVTTIHNVNEFISIEHMHLFDIDNVQRIKP